MARNAQTDADWRALYPFESHWVDLPGGRMHFVDEGPGKALKNGAHPAEVSTLLFVHGNPTWSFHWRRLIEALRGQYRCVAPDHVGCGLSEKPARYLTLQDHIANLSALVEQLDLRRATLVAQDWGGDWAGARQVPRGSLLESCGMEVRHDGPQ